jgi:hypothetical protein
MDKTLEVLESLADAARAFWERDGQEDYFEIELVRAEDYLEEVKKNADL